MTEATIVIRKPPRIAELTRAEQLMMNYMFELATQIQQMVVQFQTVAASLPSGFDPGLLIDPDDATIATAQSTANAAYELAAAASTDADAALVAATAAAATAASALAKLAAIAAVSPYAGAITNPVTGTEGTAINAVPTAIIAAAA